MFRPRSKSFDVTISRGRLDPVMDYARCVEEALKHYAGMHTKVIIKQKDEETFDVFVLEQPEFRDA